MWSGPRNLSTALMYSFGNRPDTAVWDEPFYAAYLAATGLDHPMRAEILQAGDTDAARIASRCNGPLPDGKSVLYQKHMTHHMLPEFPLGWLENVTNIFLIRRPDRVIASYHAKRENPTLSDLGFQQQAEIFQSLSAQNPVVIDSDDILKAPEPALRALCKAIKLPFSPAMLNWPQDGHASDGPWAKHWYNAVHKSTGFAQGVSSPPMLTEEGKALCAQAQPFYDQLTPFRLKLSG
ncbi:MAG: HAD family hydrolase [Rhodobacteraceae bacterium]|nr:HAD family hydrolase [Paracoccaceae bacterium]